MDPFLSCNKISDNIYWLSNNVVMRFNVALYRTNSKGEKKFFYTEYEYERDRQTHITIRRNYDYYLSLDGLDKNNKESVMITPKDIYRFKLLVSTVTKWFTDKKYKNLFVKNKGKLIMTAPIPEVEINGLPNAKSIRVDPIVIEYGESVADQYPGVRFTFGEYSFDMNVDQIMSFNDFIQSINMILMAQLVLAAIPMPLGTNRVKIDDGTPSNYFRAMQFERIDKSGRGSTNGIDGRRVKRPDESDKKGFDDLE